MRFHGFLLPFLSYALAASALNVQFGQTKRAPLQTRGASGQINVIRKVSPTVKRPAVLALGDGVGDVSISTVRDLVYLANITVAGVQYPLQLDTGSSDLWIKGPSSPLANVNDSPTQFNLTYGIGWAFGHIAYAPVNFAGITVQSQALLDVSSADNPALGYGAEGILGLGFTSLSNIDSLINKTGATTGRSLLYNLFASNPSQPNFIAFTMQRSSDLNDEVQGTFAIGEFDPKYPGIANSPAIPTFPVNAPSRWNVLLQSFIVHGKTISVTSSVKGAPSNNAVVLLDSGTSYTYLPEEYCDAIYKDVDGAHFDTNLGQWILPCDTEIDMAIQFAGQVYPLHPLDVLPHAIGDPNVCVGSFVPQPVAIGAGQFDWLLGDNFLRSVYSIYDFGDFDSTGAMGNPYVKLFSIIDPNEASKEFHAQRGGTASGNITYNASGAGATPSGSTSVSVSDDLAANLVKLGGYLPAMLGIMALNALALIALAIVGVIFLCRGRKRKAAAGGASAPKKKKSKGKLNESTRSDTLEAEEDVPDAGINPVISVTGSQEDLPSPSYQRVSLALGEPNSPIQSAHRMSMAPQSPALTAHRLSMASPSPGMNSNRASMVPQGPMANPHRASMMSQSAANRASVVPLPQSPLANSNRMSMASQHPIHPPSRLSMAPAEPSSPVPDDSRPSMGMPPPSPSHSQSSHHTHISISPSPEDNGNHVVIEPPPVPPRRRWNPDSLTPLPPADRPRTTYVVGVPPTHRQSTMEQTDDMEFAPPSPSFRMAENGRPRSMV